jgi:16S rRNA (adenine1518-N6/adenine1519-N6)-dimethyltransferase
VGRRLGQHYLNDPAILDRIVDAIDPRPDDVVVEIGPGKGTLTRRLAPRVGETVAIERDPGLARELGVRSADFGLSQLHRIRIVEGDALEADWLALVSQSAIRNPQSAFKVIGNIPYYITSPLIEKALTPPFPSVIVYLVQREFADRLTAGPGSKEFGALSVGVQAVAAVERLFLVRAGAFSPPPKVDSAVVRLKVRDRPLVSPEEHPRLRIFLAAVFSQRRKQIVRGIRNVTQSGKEGAEKLLKELGIDPSDRAEVLGVQQLLDLFRRVTAL